MIFLYTLNPVYLNALQLVRHSSLPEDAKELIAAMWVLPLLLPLLLLLLMLLLLPFLTICACVKKPTG
jgi:hypothetical protein